MPEDTDPTPAPRHSPSPASAATRRPFGAFIRSRLEPKRSKLVARLFESYAAMADASAVTQFINATCETREFIDRQLHKWPGLLGGSVTPFSTFRGAFIEESTLRLAELVLHEQGLEGLDVVKLGTGQGIITGVSLAFRKGQVSSNIPIVFRRDREDVVIGLRRTLYMADGTGGRCNFPNELVPICFVACKVYLDATRLENVLAKARNVYAQYSACHFAVVAEWDALGSDWHDEDGLLLDSLVAPVEQAFFLRGDAARRPQNDKLRAASLRNPYDSAKLRALADFLRMSVEPWRKSEDG